LAASIYPIYYSLSSDSKELRIAIEAVQLVPAPIPPAIYAIKLIMRNPQKFST